MFGIGIVLGLVGTNWMFLTLCFLPEVIPYETFPLLLTESNTIVSGNCMHCYVFPTLLQTAGMFNGFTTSNLEYVKIRIVSYEHFKEFLKNIFQAVFVVVHLVAFIGLVPHIGSNVSCK